MGITCYIIALCFYLFAGSIFCKLYIDSTNYKNRNKIRKPINKIKRVSQRLSIILFYPLYIIGILCLLIVELLTEDEPFK